MNKHPVAIAWWFQLAVYAQLWVSEMSEQTSSNLEEVWLGHDDSMDEHDQTRLQSQNGFDWQ